MLSNVKIYFRLKSFYKDLIVKVMEIMKSPYSLN